MNTWVRSRVTLQPSLIYSTRLTARIGDHNTTRWPRTWAILSFEPFWDERLEDPDVGFVLRTADEYGLRVRIVD